LKQAVFEKSPRLGRTILLKACDEEDLVTNIVFNLPVIKRFEGVKTVVTVLFILDDDAYVCENYVLGIGYRKGAIAAASFPLMRVYGPSTTLYHEGAHVLGLRHPHDADPYPWAKNLVNWLYDWSSTPMTYCRSCRLRSMYEGEYFTAIDKDNVDIGVTLKMIKDARRAVYNALIALENSKIPTPASIEPLLRAVDSDIKKAAQEMAAYNYFNWEAFYGIGAQKASAFDYAYSALQNALQLSKSVEIFLGDLAEKTRAEGELQTLRDEYTRLRNENTRLESEINSLKTSLEQARRENTALNEQLQALRNEVNTLKDRVNSLQTEKQSLENERNNLASKLREIETELGNMRLITTVLAAVLVAAVAGSLIITRIRGRRVAPPPPPPTTVQ
jgi:predicted  nucleic acid-binding Zn-ribbon protein